jgi:glutathione reductase (NADPH)
VQGKEIERLNGVYGSILKNAGVESVEGRAVFKDAHTVVVYAADGSLIREMTAANILVASGASAQILTFVEGYEHCITSDHALSLPVQPKRVVILGAGYIAVEFATIFAGLGSKVDLFFRKDHPLTGAPLSALLICLPIRLPAPASPRTHTRTHTHA